MSHHYTSHAIKREKKKELTHDSPTADPEPSDVEEGLPELEGPAVEQHRLLAVPVESAHGPGGPRAPLHADVHQGPAEDAQGTGQTAGRQQAARRAQAPQEEGRRRQGCPGAGR